MNTLFIGNAFIYFPVIGKKCPAPPFNIDELAVAAHIKRYL